MRHGDRKPANQQTTTQKPQSSDKLLVVQNATVPQCLSRGLKTRHEGANIQASGSNAQQFNI